MKRLLSLSLVLTMVVFAGTALAAKGDFQADRDMSEVHFAVPGENVVLTSWVNGHRLQMKENAGPDTFALFGYQDGGPFISEARFQDALTGVTPIDLGTDPTAGWISVDLTDNPVFWQVNTFNASNLAGNGAGNNAAWCGQTAAQQPGWDDAPGYGNGWFDLLIYEETVADPNVGQTVGLDFFFNHDTEPGYDYFLVQYDSAGQWITALSLDGTNKDASNVFAAPGVQYSTTAATPIVYVGGDYGGDAGDQVRIRFVGSSDGAWSDEDGLWPTSGAAQVDDITVTTLAGATFDDFESGFGNWTPDKAPFAGDFADTYARMTDLDPCNENTSPVVAFVDRGQTVNNADSASAIPGYPTSTGGTTSANWSYGFPGGWVINYNGGLSFGEVSMSNEVWSREIDWDLPGTADDSAEISGAIVAFDVWQHLPLGNGMFYVWHVRSTQDGVAWTAWQDRNFVYYGGGVTLWSRRNAETTVDNRLYIGDLILGSPLKVQLAVGMTDLAAAFAFPGDDATPSPVFDNVGLAKYRIQGPGHVSRQIDLANDGFPVSGSIDASTEVARDGLDIPWDTSRDVSTGTANIPGDSIIVDIVSSIPGATLTDSRMKWALIKNPFFEDAIRQAPNRIKDENVDTTNPAVWFGEVVADTAKTSAGAVVDDRFFYDLPDVDFMYPGDVLHYYIESTDSDGRMTTFPGNLTGFGDPNGGYFRSFIVRGLPSISDASGTQPTKLVYNDFGRRGGENDFVSAFGQLGLVEGVDFDTYTTNGPSSGVSNSLGSAGAHGANADQLAGYDTIVYFSGNLSTFLFSNGSNSGQNDKADDVGVLTAWHDLPGNRNAVYFADYIASANIADSAEAAVYVQTIMGVNLNDADVRDEIDGQTAPTVRPLNAAFAEEFVAFGGCAAINQFDSITALAPATRGHGFVDLGGSVYANLAASVIHDRVVGTDRKVDMTFPFGFIYLYEPMNKAPGSESARTSVLREIFDFFGVPSGGGNVVSAPTAKQAEMSVVPNPFNPSTSIKLSLPQTGDVDLRVYNIRGQLVKTLHSGELEAGERTFVWQGQDNNGVRVASGVYMVVGKTQGGDVLKQKVALVK
jgi:hypothetical protein